MLISMGRLIRAMLKMVISIPPYERSLPPLLHDFDPTMCYLPNGYPSAVKPFSNPLINRRPQTLLTQYISYDRFSNKHRAFLAAITTMSLRLTPMQFEIQNGVRRWQQRLRP